MRVVKAVASLHIFPDSPVVDARQCSKYKNLMCLLIQRKFIPVNLYGPQHGKTGLEGQILLYFFPKFTYNLILSIQIMVRISLSFLICWFKHVVCVLKTNISSRKPSHLDSSFEYPQHNICFRCEMTKLNFTYTLLSGGM